MGAGRLRAAAAVVLAASLLASCHQLNNPLDPRSTTFDGEIVLRDPLQDPVLPRTVRWESVAEHFPGQFLALEITEDGSFVEPRRPDSPAELWIVVTFERPVHWHELYETLFILGVDHGGGPHYRLWWPHDVWPERRQIGFRVMSGEPPLDGLPTGVTARMRIVDVTGISLGERSWAALPGDFNGDRRVNEADRDGGPVAYNGYLASQANPRTIRADFDASGVVDGLPAGADYVLADAPGPAGNRGAMLPPPVPPFPDTITEPVPGPSPPQPETYTITYHGNGHTSGNPPVDPNDYRAGADVTIAEPGTLGRENHAFDGWNTDPGGAGDGYLPGPAIMPASDLELHAQWLPEVLFAGGDGTEAAPYLVATAEHLNNVRSRPGAHFRQTANIALGVSPWNEGQGWLPIGGAGTPFTGVYDGDGHLIDGLFITRASIGVGLFGVTSGATIRNLGVSNASVTNDQNNTGILVGDASATTIQDCFVTGVVVGAAGAGMAGNVGGLVGYFNGAGIARCGAIVQVSGANRAGGLVGQVAGGVIVQSAADGTVVATDLQMVGGLVGQTGPGVLIHDSYATAAVNAGPVSFVGGLVGRNEGTIDRAYAAGPVSSTGADVGGLAGGNTGAVSASYYDEYTTGRSDVGKGQPLPTASMLQASTYAGWDLVGTWAIAEGSSYPRLLALGPMGVPVPATAFAVRGFGPAGGPVFHDKGLYSDGWRYMEATAVHLPGWAHWSITWSLTGAAGTAIGDGLGNTLQIAAVLGEQPGMAYQLALDHAEGGFDDWFLPSIGELAEMDDKLHPVGDYGFDLAPHWSSSELDAVSAWLWSFWSREAVSVQKDAATYRVRPARRF